MVDVVATPARAGTSYVEWGAVFAGALAASAISFVLLTAGGSTRPVAALALRRSVLFQDRGFGGGVLVRRGSDPVLARRWLHRRAHALGMGIWLLR